MSTTTLSKRCSAWLVLGRVIGTTRITRAMRKAALNAGTPAPGRQVRSR